MTIIPFRPPDPAIQPPSLAIQPTNAVSQASASTHAAQAEACQHSPIRTRQYDPEITATSGPHQFTNFLEKHFRRKLILDQVCDILETQAVPSVDALVATTLDPPHASTVPYLTAIIHLA
jgi:hypothetical protein